MKRAGVLLFLLLSVSLCLPVFGEVFNGPTNLSLKRFDALTINGPANLKLVKAKTLEIKGPLQFHSLDVAGKADVQGTMNGDKGKFGQLSVLGTMETDHVMCEELSVKGPVKATYLDVQNKATVEGPLEVQHGKFKDLAVTAEKIQLADVVVETITVKASQNSQILILKGETIVNGDIVFESGNGSVQIENPEVSIKGSVKGASVKK